VQRGAAGADAQPAAQGAVGGVDVDAHADGAAFGVPFDEVEVVVAVDHEGDGAGGVLVAGEGGEGGAVGGGVGDEDVVADAVPGQPEGLGEGEGHDAGEAVEGEDLLQERPAAHGLAGDADGLAGGAADQVGGVGPERGQVHDRERGVEGGGGRVVALPEVHGHTLP